MVGPLRGLRTSRPRHDHRLRRHTRRRDRPYLNGPPSQCSAALPAVAAPAAARPAAPAGRTPRPRGALKPNRRPVRPLRDDGRIGVSPRPKPGPDDCNVRDYPPRPAPRRRSRTPAALTAQSLDRPSVTRRPSVPGKADGDRSQGPGVDPPASADSLTTSRLGLAMGRQSASGSATGPVVAPTPAHVHHSRPGRCHCPDRYPDSAAHTVGGCNSQGTQSG